MVKFADWCWLIKPFGGYAPLYLACLAFGIFLWTGLVW